MAVQFQAVMRAPPQVVVGGARGQDAAAGRRGREWLGLLRVEVNVRLPQSKPPFHFPVWPERHFPTLIVQIDHVDVQPASQAGWSIRSEERFRAVRSEESIRQSEPSKARGESI